MTFLNRCQAWLHCPGIRWLATKETRTVVKKTNLAQSTSSLSWDRVKGNISTERRNKPHSDSSFSCFLLHNSSSSQTDVFQHKACFSVLALCWNASVCCYYAIKSMKMSSRSAVYSFFLCVSWYCTRHNWNIGLSRFCPYFGLFIIYLMMTPTFS